MFSLFLKEVTGFFNSLTGYLVIIVFLIITSLFMWVFEGPMNILDGGYATLSTLFTMAPWVFLMLVPAITMRSFAEEKRSGTLELLQTRPLTDMQIVLAKFLASVVLIVLALLPTLVYYISVVYLGNPLGNIDTGGTWGSYIGLFFLAIAYASIGLFCSSVTDNLIISFMLSAILSLFMCYGFEQFSTFFEMGKSGKFLLSLGIIEHYKSLSRGVVDTRDLIYFISLISIFLLLTKFTLETARR
jgi:ABC-2 type transport system permease protein